MRSGEGERELLFEGVVPSYVAMIFRDVFLHFYDSGDGRFVANPHSQEVIWRLSLLPWLCRAFVHSCLGFCVSLMGRNVVLHGGLSFHSLSLHEIPRRC